MAAAAGCSSTNTGTSTASRLQSQYERVVREVLPSVVQITTDTSTGSGIVYDHDGDIVTNEHVIGGAKTVRVQESVGNTTLTAKVIGKFNPDDIEVIRVDKDAGSLNPARFANSNDTQIGQIVLAMGNPLGLTDSVTQGIVSATGRTVGTSEPNGGTALITPAIQTSAAINPGNSGGALVNLDGSVIGIPTLAAQLPGNAGAAPGIGFAIPSNTVRTIADQLIQSGKVASSGDASLGLTAQTAADSSGHPVGVAVLAVAGGGTAATAGVMTGDVIVGLDKNKVTSLEDLEGMVAMLKPGATVTIYYTRGASTTVRSGSAKVGSLSS
ncbi:MAG TPA: trypsin-like peptidase domain-containing protein [Streptosporangiaceae bacterium]|nr:trypsin-like peptidase domain-containing protein [Streptosporangiaceae bacterium]